MLESQNRRPDPILFRVFENAQVNIRGPFIGGARFGNYSGRAGRALAFLHEIAHMIQTGYARDANGRITRSTYLIPDDGAAPNQSIINTATVEEKCKKELDALNQ